MSETKVYAITGYPGAGKSTAREVFEDEGYLTFEVGNLVTGAAEEIRYDPEEGSERYGLNETPETVARWSRGKVISELPQRQITGMVEEKLDEMFDAVTDKIAVSGVRSPDTLKMLEEKVGENKLEIIYIDADANTRYGRKNLSWEEFHERTQREMRTGLGEISRKNIGEQKYDVRIENNSEGTEALQEFDSKVRKKAREGKRRQPKNELR